MYIETHPSRKFTKANSVSSKENLDLFNNGPSMLVTENFLLSNKMEKSENCCFKSENFVKSSDAKLDLKKKFWWHF